MSRSLFACTVALVVDAPSPRADHAFSGRIVKRRTAKHCWKYIQMLVKKKRLLLEHIPGLQNPSDGLTKSFKTRIC